MNAFLLFAAFAVSITFFDVMSEYAELYQKMVYANETLAEDVVQERALYQECMELTYHIPAHLKVDRRLLK